MAFVLDKLQEILALHEVLLEDNPYCYFEFCYTRPTRWVVWLCSDCKEHNTERVVLAVGQGDSIDEAAGIALKDYETRKESTK
jgi:hypothetical protein